MTPEKWGLLFRIPSSGPVKQQPKEKEKGYLLIARWEPQCHSVVHGYYLELCIDCQVSQIIAAALDLCSRLKKNCARLIIISIIITIIIIFGLRLFPLLLRTSLPLHFPHQSLSHFSFFFSVSSVVASLLVQDEGM